MQKDLILALFAFVVTASLFIILRSVCVKVIPADSIKLVLRFFFTIIILLLLLLARNN